MPPYPSQEKQLRLDLKLLTKFVYELNIARHHSVTYPPGHPVIAQSILRSLSYLRQLQPETGLLSLGISKNKLAVGQIFLDEKNPVFREFAAHLFGHGVAVISVQQNLDERQLRHFLEIIGQNRETVRDRGGLLQMMKDGDIKAIHIRPIDYNVFGVTEQIDGAPLNRTAIKKKEAAIWEQFVQNLLTGHSAEHASPPSARQKLAPQAVAEQMNDLALNEEIHLEGHYDQAITEFLRELDREQLADMSNSTTLVRLKDLASRLNPELRAQLLNSTFRAVASNEKVAEQVLGKFPGTMLMEVLETLNARKTTIPPIIFTLLDRLTRCETGRPPEKISFNTISETENAAAGFEQVLSPLYERDQSDNFIPGAYSETLRQVEGHAGPETGAPVDIHFWQSAFSQQPLESKVSDIVFELARNGQTEATAGTLKETVQDLCGLFLDTGDFAALGDIYARLAPLAEQDICASPVWFEELRNELEASQFIEKILDTLQAWGKNAFDEVARLLETIGPATIAPLLNRLAVESNRALRQFYMNCLVDQGPAVQTEVVTRLRDERWYYLRNLIIVLRRLGDPFAMAEIDALWNHPNEKVRREVLKTALIFHTPQGNSHLLDELTQPDHQRRLSAAKMARHSQDPAVRSLLMDLFADRDLSRQGLRLKFAVLDSLLEQGGKDLPPLLEKRFRAFSLRHPRRLMRLQQKILRSLPHLPPRDAETLLSRLAGIKRPGLARLVRQARAELCKVSP